jgi:hypothetical protein
MILEGREEIGDAGLLEQGAFLSVSLSGTDTCRCQAVTDSGSNLLAIRHGQTAYTFCRGLFDSGDFRCADHGYRR